MKKEKLSVSQKRCKLHSLGLYRTSVFLYLVYDDGCYHRMEQLFEVDDITPKFLYMLARGTYDKWSSVSQYVVECFVVCPVLYGCRQFQAGMVKSNSCV